MAIFHLEQLAEIQAAAKWILSQMGERKILLLEGRMGAGKTTLTKAICYELGCTDTISSPTFSIIQEYDSPGGPVYHLDLYRLRNIAEAFDAGVEEVLYSGQVCIIEWPEKILPLLPEAYTSVDIQVNEHIRILQLVNHG